jgi:cobalt-zinc-cadmium efflux system membrane fusion protein
MKNVNYFSGLLLSLFILINLPALASGDHDHHGHDDHEEEAIAKGPHNGRLLVDDHFELELSIFEQGVPPEYRVWASIDEKSIPPEDLKISVQLTRLGGIVDQFTFVKQNDFLRSQQIVEEPHSFDVLVKAEYKNKQYQWNFPSYEGRVELSPEIAKASGVTTAIAGAGDIDKKITLYGKLVIAPEFQRHIKARFPGVVKKINVTPGDYVNAGDILLSIEANDSLSIYNITAPIAGKVVERHINPGEIAENNPLIRIVDDQQLTALMHVFAKDGIHIKAGQTAVIQHQHQQIVSKVESILPDIDHSSTSLVRIAVDNQQQKWLANEAVVAEISVEKIPVALRVDNRALQNFRDWQLVFIKVGNTYEIRPLELGKTDGKFTEVFSGLNQGDEYVVENSYLLKADLEKSGASHDH